jgi:hypothetical protein
MMGMEYLNVLKVRCQAEKDIMTHNRRKPLLNPLRLRDGSTGMRARGSTPTEAVMLRLRGSNTAW